MNMRLAKESSSLHYLHNYRRIYWEFQNNAINSDEKKIVERFLALITATAEKVLKAKKVPNLKDSAIKDELQLRELYYDTLQHSFLNPQKKTSEEIIDILQKKYGVQLNASKLSKLKQKSVIAFASVLDL